MTVDETLDEVAVSARGSVADAPVLFLALEGDRPHARGARFSLVGVDTVTIGRGHARVVSRSMDGRSLDLRVPGRWMSTQHVALRAAGADWIVEDQGSRNGTFIGLQRIERAVLRAGDILEAGRTYFAVRGAPAREGPLIRDEDAATSTQPFGLRTLLPELHESQSALTRVARNSSVPILLLGPTGSGKEVIAREVHAQSRRAGQFVAVNCGALPTTLVESLLFGHVKGAFSGAARDEVGFVRSADGGTLFLDEIGDLPPASQAALLRVLQENEVIPIGGTRAVKIDVRVVAATHRVLDESVAFRRDLLARLKGYTHRLPPLCERMPDFGIVIADVLAAIAGDRASTLTIAPDAARALLAYTWPLNIRELHQAMASALALLTDDLIDTRHLPMEIFSRPSVAAAPPDPDDALRDQLVALLHQHHGNVTAVARVMGKAPTQVHRWMRRLSIDPDAYR
jgi:DNA-binding NtrC family response regulator